MAKEKTVEKPVRTVAKPTMKAPPAKPMRRAAAPTKGVMKQMSPKTVRGKIALYQKTSAEFKSAARQMLHLGTRNMQAGVSAVQSGIKKQMKKYKDGAIDLQKGVAAILSNIAAMQSSIVDQVKENQEYITNFYG
jgi:hypothetical protein